MLLEHIKIKVIFLLLFTTIFTLLFNYNTNNQNLEIDIELDKFSKKLQLSLNAIINENHAEAESTSDILNGEEILIDTMSSALNGDRELKKVLREKLYKHLKPLYQIVKEEGVSNFQFILPDDSVFLRMQKPKKFGDNIHNSKLTFKDINIAREVNPLRENPLHQQVSGFKIEDEILTYSYLFPLYDDEDLYLGAYEISYSIKYIQDLMLDIDNIQTDCLFSGMKFKKDGWENKELLINNNIKNYETFTQFIQNSSNSDIDVISFLPIKSLDEKNTYAYITSCSQGRYIKDIISRYENKNIISFFVLLIFLILLYRLTLHQEKIKDERERFQLAIDSSNDGIWDWNIVKNKTYFSPRWKGILGFEENELKDDFYELKNRIHKEDKEKFLDEINALLTAKKSIFECEYRVQHKNGTWVWILGRAKAHFSKENTVLRVVGFHSDITLKKEYEAQQAQLIQELKNVATSKSDFLANMSHEIRTPMNAILGFVQILIKEENDSEKLKKFNIINQSGKSLLRIINDILDFSKIGSNKLLIENIPYNLKETIAHVAELFKVRASDNCLTLSVNIEENIPTKILGDQVRVEQVLSNLLSNAIKFSNEGGTITINLVYDKENSSVKCEIIDNGVGISTSKIDDIFNAFTQEDSTTTRKFGGTGLGLSISKALCELMGGTIGVESKLDVGSTFYFTLEICEVACEIKSDNIDKDSNNESKLNGRILIVEDNKTNQLLLSMLLDDFDLEYIVANDGLEAIEKLKNEKVDLILMDENMPNMNGIEATKVIRGMQNIKDIPIVAVTANALDGDRERFLQAGMDDYIAKPIEVSKLESVLNKFLTKG
ncbi:MAG: ATP-binding protein [Campylobacterota bacterium]|nr:ATP-binding protein [Campylobacterota bacterium]